MSLRRLFYTFFLYLLTPVVVLRLLWRSTKSPQYRMRIPERFGYAGGISEDNTIWIHAVSVGEFLAAVPLIKKVMQQYPQHKILVTTTTPTGSARVKSVFSDQVEHCYLPYDLPCAVSRFLQKVKPSLALIMETEIWPNLFSALNRRSIPLFIANARLSKKSMSGYQKVSGLVAEALSNVSHICARDNSDLERFRRLMKDKDKVSATGNIKFDITIDSEQISAGTDFKRKYLGRDRKVMIAASTHAGEDEKVLDAFNQILKQYPDLVLLIVPRHPERFVEVAELCEREGFSVVTRSSGNTIGESPIFIGDTMGEMLMYFGSADVAFIGGSLVPVGGHNMLEAIALGVPVVSGSYVHNFQDVADNMEKRAAGFLVDDENELAAKVVELLASDKLVQQTVENGKQFLKDNRGAMDSIIKRIGPILRQET
ncbi:MAG: 3-deoxy-D-manno-octulosonic acid transferase [Gammaproteobacteria bacterium]|nr:MAG: 3-deoxy-D-manno-octulosonic acid transferase [Gammaproteobacteria bacterium]